MNLVKNKTISDTLRATRLKREGMSCGVYSCKIDKSHLSKQSVEFLRMVFIEAKWFINDILASNDVFKSDYKKKNPTVLKDGKTPEERAIKYLSSQIRQSLAEKLKQDIVNLSKKKKSGGKVGRLHFKREVYSLPLKQEGVTFRIVDRNHIRIQGNNGLLKASGLNQIPKEAEIANAVLVHRASDYYIKITCFVPKEVRTKTGKSVGIDFGIETNLTTSDGKKFNISISEPTRLRRLQNGKSSRKIERSKNWIRTTKKIAVEYEKVNCQKKDLRNKLVSQLVKEYDIICCQNENIRGWHGGLFGRQVQRSCMGGIISDLKHKSETFVQVDRFYPSTKTCDVCLSQQKVELDERIFICQTCGNTKDRDIHSAINILNEGLKSFRLIRDLEDVKTPVEGLTTADLYTSQVGKPVSMKQEAIAL